MNETEHRPQSETEHRHNTVKKALKIAGVLILFVGVVFDVIGAVDFFGSFQSGDMPTRFWCLFLGIPMTAIGVFLLVFAFKREIARYVKNEAVPVINETGKEISPAVKDIASAVKAGISDAATDEIRCSCGESNSKESKFCKKCGKSLIKTCPACGKEISLDSEFCNYCGKKL